MKNKLKLSILLLLISACGKVNHKVSGVPDKFNIRHEIAIDPATIELFKDICDDAHPENEKKADKCYEDYINKFIEFQRNNEEGNHE